MPSLGGGIHLVLGIAELRDVFCSPGRAGTELYTPGTYEIFMLEEPLRLAAPVRDDGFDVHLRLTGQY